MTAVSVTSGFKVFKGALPCCPSLVCIQYCTCQRLNNERKMMSRRGENTELRVAVGIYTVCKLL